MQETLADIGRKLDTDKTQSPGYIENYERQFGPLRNTPVRLLELGVHRGGSLLIWHEYFPRGLIVGLDIQPNPLEVMPDRVRFYQGSQGDGVLLDRIAQECAPDGFDIIIDDAAHIGTLARVSFQTLFEKHLRRGGIYVIEDWGTGYWKSWSDGALYHGSQRDANEASRNRGPVPLVGGRFARWLRRPERAASDRPTDPQFAVHNFGMVGFVKELVDEVAWRDITDPARGNHSLPARRSIIREMTITFGQAFVVKA